MECEYQVTLLYFQITGLKKPQSIAVDWVGKRIYWTDTEKNTIESADFDGGKHRMVVDTHLDEPHDIVVDPGTR